MAGGGLCRYFYKQCRQRHCGMSPCLSCSMQMPLPIALGFLAVSVLLLGYARAESPAANTSAAIIARIKVPDFAKRDFVITDHGAAPGKDCTEAIINAAGELVASSAPTKAVKVETAFPMTGFAAVSGYGINTTTGGDAAQVIAVRTAREFENASNFKSNVDPASFLSNAPAEWRWENWHVLAYAYRADPVDEVPAIVRRDAGTGKVSDSELTRAAR